MNAKQGQTQTKQVTFAPNFSPSGTQSTRKYPRRASFTHHETKKTSLTNEHRGQTKALLTAFAR